MRRLRDGSNRESYLISRKIKNCRCKQSKKRNSFTTSNHQGGVQPLFGKKVLILKILSSIFTQNIVQKLMRKENSSLQSCLKPTKITLKLAITFKLQVCVQFYFSIHKILILYFRELISHHNF